MSSYHETGEPMLQVKTRLFFALLIAFVLTIMPLPPVFSAIRPPWIFLLVLYVQFFYAHYFSVGFLLFLGLCLDVLTSSILGVHAFAMLFTTWLISGKATRVGFFPVAQQTVLAGLFCFIFQSLLMAINGACGYQMNFGVVLVSSLLSGLFWPWCKWGLDGFLIRKSKYRPKIS